MFLPLSLPFLTYYAVYALFLICINKSMVVLVDLSLSPKCVHFFSWPCSRITGFMVSIDFLRPNYSTLLSRFCFPRIDHYKSKVNTSKIMNIAFFQFLFCYGLWRPHSFWQIKIPILLFTHHLWLYLLLLLLFIKRTERKLTKVIKKKHMPIKKKTQGGAYQSLFTNKNWKSYR
jgi:hypothetical protein